MKFPVTVALALFAAVVAFLSHSADAATIYPQPSKVKYDEKTTYSMRREQFKFDVASGSSEILESAFRRYTNIIFGDAKSVQQRLSGLRAPMLANPFAHTGCNSNATVTRLVVTVSSTSEVLQPEQDESYMLETDKPSIAYLTAPTVWGALRGLESFAQLVRHPFFQAMFRLTSISMFKQINLKIIASLFSLPKSFVYFLVNPCCSS